MTDPRKIEEALLHAIALADAMQGLRGDPELSDESHAWANHLRERLRARFVMAKEAELDATPQAPLTSARAEFEAALTAAGLSINNVTRVERDGGYLYECWDDADGHEIGFIKWIVPGPTYTLHEKKEA